MTLISRRRTMQILAAGTALLPLATRAQSPAAAAGRLLVISDLHSAYERSAQLLAALRAEVAAHPVPHLILINGDVFELGNVVTTRSNGVIDMALLQALADLAPTVLNLGNHEADLVDDTSTIVAEAKALGITVLSNILDARTNKPYTEAVATLRLGDLPVNLVGIATAAINTYPKAQRETLSIPNPVDWAAANLASALAGPGLNVVLSHAGVLADRAILPTLADGSLLIGGHDHLSFVHDAGNTRYLHTGSWSALYSVVDVSAEAGLSVTQVAVDVAGPKDDALAALIEATLKTHLTTEETEIVATSAETLSLAQTARFVAAAMAKAADADVGFISHTTLGAGLPSGEVDRYTYNSVVRFDGKLVVAEVDAAVLREILAITDQDNASDLSQRTGDFLYSAPDGLADKPRYKIVTGDWPAMNQKAYFLREDLVFTPGPELAIKALVLDAINGKT